MKKERLRKAMNILSSSKHLVVRDKGSKKHA
jgi:hypothetical protein